MAACVCDSIPPACVCDSMVSNDGAGDRRQVREEEENGRKKETGALICEADVPIEGEEKREKKLRRVIRAQTRGYFCPNSCVRDAY